MFWKFGKMLSTSTIKLKSPKKIVSNGAKFVFFVQVKWSTMRSNPCNIYLRPVGCGIDDNAESQCISNDNVKSHKRAARYNCAYLRFRFHSKRSNTYRPLERNECLQFRGRCQWKPKYNDPSSRCRGRTLRVYSNRCCYPKHDTNTIHSNTIINIFHTRYNFFYHCIALANTQSSRISIITYRSNSIHCSVHRNYFDC